ncbi:MAG: hypothetical protein AAB408_03465 [Patescibacteria group bacterium]
MKEFFFSVGQAALTQLIGVLGIFFLFGWLLSIIQTWTQQKYHESVGWKGILWTAWLGTPIHEVGHMVFAKLFRHRIERVALFQPNEETGDLGSVGHSFAKYSLYQRIGNFFIGAAPLIFGSLFLVLLLYFLLPNGREVFTPLSHQPNSLLEAFTSFRGTLTHLFSVENLRAWNFWVFLYVSFCIASHMAPSQPDRKNMWGGFFWLVLILLVVNSIAALIHRDPTAYILRLNQYLGIVAGMFLYALLLSVLHLILATVVLLPFRRR